MLPSCGYFKSAICPFFKSGLCERPNCHFKHVRPEPTGTTSTYWTSTEVNDSGIDKKPDVTECLGQNVQLVNKPNVPPTYNPTPVARCNATQGILKASSIKQENLAPEYKPTPISQLEPSNLKPAISVPEITFLQSVVRKRKKVVEEYIPEEVRCPTRRRVSFNLPEEKIKKEDIEDLNEVITVDSSDDEFAENAPTFSDDDDEDAKPIVIQCKQEKKAVSSNIVEEEVIPIGEYSLVDKILVDVTKNEEFIRSFKNPRVTAVSTDKNAVVLHETTLHSNAPKFMPAVKNSEVESIKDDMDTVKKRAIAANESIDESSKKTDLDHITIEKKELSKDKSNEKSTKNSGSKSTHDELKSFKKHSFDLPADKKSDYKDVSTKKHDSNLPQLKKDKITRRESVEKSPNNDAKCKSKVSSESSGKASSKSTDSKNSRHSHKSSSHSSKTELKSEKKSVQNGEIKTDHKKNSHSLHSKHGDEKRMDKPKSHSSKIEGKDKTDSHFKEKHKTENPNGEKSDRQSSSKRKSDPSKGSDMKKLKTLPRESEFKKDLKKIQDEKITSSVSISKEIKSSHSTSSDNESSIKSSSRHTESKSEKIRDKNVHSASSKTFATHHLKPKNSASKHSKIAKPAPMVADVHSSPEKPVSGSNETTVTSSDSEDDDDDDDNDVNEECWRIFNESENSSTLQHENSSPENSSNSIENNHSSPPDAPSDLLNFKRRRLAHQASFQRPAEDRPKPPTKLLNPTQIMQKRFLTMQEIYSKQNEKQVLNPFSSSMGKVSDAQKKRIAAIPNLSLVNAVMQKSKYPLSSNSNHSSDPFLNDDPSSRVSNSIKASKRVAHIPLVATKPRPIIPSAIGNKVPSNIRQKYLNCFIDECLKFCKTEDQAFEMALEEETLAYNRCSSRTVYLNVAANALSRLRHQAREGPIDDSVESGTSTTSSSNLPRKTVSHETVLAGARAQKLSYSIEKRKYKPPEVVIKGIALYRALQEYVMTEDQLRDQGFPFSCPTEPGRAVISGIYSNKHHPAPTHDTSKRICSRCQKTYYVADGGDYVKEEECDFHWGKLFKRRIAGQFEARYTCCSSDAESEGCCVGPGHVFEGYDSHLLKGFVQTLPKTPPSDGYYGVYALDCEMCYTTAGIELTRVTVISPEMKPIFETYVKPEHRVLDYNTRFSGIKEEDLDGITTSIRDVQAIMLLMFNDKTILIGHSLESDLKALKLIHKTVVDTSIVFPHKLGLPYKRGLRTLMAEKCNKIIQNSTEGHDSQEDAVACMELMLWRLKEDAKCPR